MRLLSYKKTGSLLLVIIIILILLLLMGRHYINYEKALKNKQGSIELTEKNDFGDLKGKSFDELEGLGFDKKEITAFHAMTQRNLTLADFVGITGDHEGKVVNFTDLLPGESIRIEETDDVNNLVEIKTGPVEIVYLDKENKTFFTKLNYTIEVKNPMFFQLKDQFKLDTNEWYYLFGYSKLHYVSKTGEEYAEYIDGEKLIGVENTPLKFEVRRKVNKEIFYLTGITGFIVMESIGDLSLNAEYIHNRPIGNIVGGQHHSDWQWTIEN